ncbi:MAG: arginine--tRNA ligase [Clostridiales bacterium]|nr:arginine--tRNA ligase [Clostridiales bacterium]
MSIKERIAAKVGELSGVDAAEIEGWFEVPPTPDKGDIALPCFKLARSLRKAPPMIAAELAEAFAGYEGIVRAEPAGGYLNFFLDRSDEARKVVLEVINSGESYGCSDEGEGRNVCIDFSSINICKPFGIHHITTTVLGHSLSRIFRHLGYSPVRINHLGDWGTQFGKMLVAYKKWGDRETIENAASPTRELVALYVKYHQEAETDPSLDDEARAAFRSIELHDPENWELYQWFKELTIREAERVYKLLGVEFDSYNGEAFYEDKMPAVIDELREKGVTTVDNGMTIVDLSAYDMPPCLILKSNGGTIYPTRDITAAIYRKNTYDFYKNLYVVAYQQNLHFRQVFKTLELMGYDWAKDCVHVNFGMISMADMTFSTRKGNAIYLEDVLMKAIEKTKAIMTEKSPDLPDMDEVARQVGVGAVVWGPLYSSRIKDFTFSWDKALNFEGETAPYAQYTHARCCSVLRKAEGYDIEKADWSCLDNESCSALVKAMKALPESIRLAADKYEPYLISRNVIEICSAFNKFYFENRIMDEDEGVRNARLALTLAAKTAIKTGLYLVGIEAPERM